MGTNAEGGVTRHQWARACEHPPIKRIVIGTNMPRNMSFALTTEQFKKKTKTVTRRFGWSFLKPGDIVCGVEKAMGLKKGEKIKKLGLIKIISVREECLRDITQADCVREGFPEMTPDQFVGFLISHDKTGDTNPMSVVNRIEFEYL